jgi:hypothetical protein
VFPLDKIVYLSSESENVLTGPSCCVTLMYRAR